MYWPESVSYYSGMSAGSGYCSLSDRLPARDGRRAGDYQAFDGLPGSSSYQGYLDLSCAVSGSGGSADLPANGSRPVCSQVHGMSGAKGDYPGLPGSLPNGLPGTLRTYLPSDTA